MADSRRHPAAWQELLRAALLESEAAERAFWRWQEMVALDDVPTVENALLPLLTGNLQAAGVSHVWMGRLKGVTRRTWYANQIVLQALAETLATPGMSELDVLVAGTVAVAPLLGDETPMLPVYAPELIVPRGQRQAALDGLQAAGWRAEGSAPPLHDAALQRWVSGQRLRNGSQQALWLNWHVLRAAPCEALDDSWREAAVPFRLQQVCGRTLCATDQLVRSLLQAHGGSLAALADAVRLMRRGNLDWQRLVQTAHRYRLGPPLLEVLEIVEETLGQHAAAEVMVALQAGDVRFYERPRAELIRPYGGRLWRRFWHSYGRFRRTAACRGTDGSLRNFFLFWQANRGLQS